MIKVDVVTKDFSGALRQFRRFWGINQEEALKTQGRLLAERLVTFTPPRRLDQGEGAIQSDFARAFRKGYRGQDGGRFFYEDNKRYSLPRNATGSKLTVPPSDKRGKPVEVFDKTGVDGRSLAAHHQRFRNSRGRIAAVRAPAVTDPDLLDDFKERKLWNVGQAKGGWMAGSLMWQGNAKFAGGRAKLAKRQWIMRHASKGSARYIDHKHHPRIELANFSEWAKRSREGARITANALRSQSRNILKSIQIAARDAAQKARLSKGIYRIQT